MIEVALMYVGIFLIQFVVEMAFVAYLYCVESRKPMKAALLGGLCYTLHATCVIAFIQNIGFLISVILGVVVGTWVVVEYQRRKQVNDASKD